MAKATGSNASSSRGTSQIQRPGPSTIGTAKTRAPQPLRESVASISATWVTTRAKLMPQSPKATGPERQRRQCCRKAASTSGQLKASQAAVMLA